MMLSVVTLIVVIEVDDVILTEPLFRLLSNEDVLFVSAQNFSFVCTVFNSGFAWLFWFFFLQVWLSQLLEILHLQYFQQVKSNIYWLACNPIQSKFQCWIVQWREKRTQGNSVDNYLYLVQTMAFIWSTILHTVTNLNAHKYWLYILPYILPWLSPYCCTEPTWMKLNTYKIIAILCWMHISKQHMYTTGLVYVLQLFNTANK